ncbi:DUF1722 domain-containing protein [Litorilinea aerophila]|uniref:DUF1722 domain-containing protein n=1 Tax=Litorilinea aerophila TaxID=1204385 RepID=A0A540VE55_9CHLR|nr:DUF1722 domain-containing protein [Litorilinea aerophila]MCC9077190.1 DUF1722 domain-containing protein [Litorilinea aerophila]
MRIWDLHPGYLDRQRLLGEHRELHGLASVHLHGKKGYAAHPETRRWAGCLGALAVRHELLVAEMALRGYRHHSPLLIQPDPTCWPGYLDTPARQLALLAGKYTAGEQGRIPLPRHLQQAWAQHKYSVLARDPNAYRSFGRRAAEPRNALDEEFLHELIQLLRQPPTRGGVQNAIDHMWGHVAQYATPTERHAAGQDLATRWHLTQRLARDHAEDYLWHSTALSEMTFWLTWL